jgi:hypothetical protein
MPDTLYQVKKYNKSTACGVNPNLLKILKRGITPKILLSELCPLSNNFKLS